MSKPTEEEKAAVRDFMATFAAVLKEHEPHDWEQIGPCVYCTPCGTRLYQGVLPEQKRKVPRCRDGEHDWDEESGQGFYAICRKCKTLEWYE